jgi:hypothetical protein
VTLPEGFCAYEDGALTCDEPFMSWRATEQKACLDGDFTVEQLEAIARYMRAMLGG